MSVIDLDYSLSKLVSTSFRQRINPSTFVSLFIQLEKASTIEDDDFEKNLLDLTSESAHPKILILKLSYSSAISLSSSIQSSRFWRLLSQIDFKSQIKHLGQFLKVLEGKVSSSSVKFEPRDYTIKDVFHYLHQAVKSLENSNDINHAYFLENVTSVWESLSENFAQNIPRENLDDFIRELSSALKAYRMNGALGRLLMNSSSFNPGEHEYSNMEVSTQQSHNSSSHGGFFIDSGKGRKLHHIRKIKKHLWLNEQIKNWKFNSESFIDLFGTYSMISSLSPIQNIQHLVKDLIVCSFKGFASSIETSSPEYVLFNWNGFIMVILPKLLNNIKGKLSSNISSGFQDDSSNKFEIFEEAIVKAFKSLDSKLYKIIQQYMSVLLGDKGYYEAFISVCISEKVFDSKFYASLFPSEGEYSTDWIKHFETPESDNINEQIQKRLLNINSEFTSLEESGLVSYISELPKLLYFNSTGQDELSRVLHLSINTLVFEKDNEKLTRLLLAMSKNSETLYIVCFHSKNGPIEILSNLINYVDAENFNVDDDDSFQETYSYLGIIVLTIVRIIEVFCIDYSSLFIKDSYVMEYIDRYYYGSNDNISLEFRPEVLEAGMAKQKSVIFENWANALFNEGNDGISDEVIKSVNSKQIYKLIPVVYSQAISAVECKIIDMEILRNGLDYLSQPFLMPCSLAIISWLLRKISDNVDSSGLFLEVLSEILKISMRENEEQESDSHLIFHTILQITGKNIEESLTRLSGYKDSALAQDIVNKVKKISTSPFSKGIIKEQVKFETLENIKNVILTSLNQGSIDPFLAGFEIKFQFGDLVLEFLRDNEIALHKSIFSNEDIRLLMEILIFIILLKTVKNAETKERCLNIFSSSNPVTNQMNEVPESLEFRSSENISFWDIFHVPDDCKTDDLTGVEVSDLKGIQLSKYQSDINLFKSGIYKLQNLSVEISHMPERYGELFLFLKNRFKEELEEFAVLN